MTTDDFTPPGVLQIERQLGKGRQYVERVVKDGKHHARLTIEFEDGSEQTIDFGPADACGQNAMFRLGQKFAAKLPVVVCFAATGVFVDKNMSAQPGGFVLSQACDGTLRVSDCLFVQKADGTFAANAWNKRERCGDHGLVWFWRGVQCEIADKLFGLGEDEEERDE